MRDRPAFEFDDEVLFRALAAGMSETRLQGYDCPAIDQEEAKRIMERLVKTPPDPGHKARVSESDQKQKPGGHPAKNNRPEESKP